MAQAAANAESVHILEIWPSPAPAKFLARFGGCQCSCTLLQYVELITDKTNVADLSSGIFAILISVTRTTTKQNPLPFHKFRDKLANSDVTKEAMNCTASLQQLTALLMPLVSSGSLIIQANSFFYGSFYRHFLGPGFSLVAS